MTESEWLTGRDPRLMMRFLRHGAGYAAVLRSWFSSTEEHALPRNWRLFLAACCQRVLPHIESRERWARQLLDFAWDHVESTPTAEDRLTAKSLMPQRNCSWQGTRFLQGFFAPLGSAAGELRNVAGCQARAVAADKTRKDAAQRAALDAEGEFQCLLLRDIFGNPFRSVAFAPCWRSRTAVALVAQIYESQDFGTMPMLADALQDAGCEDACILDHCRRPSPHVRGCWVVDLVLDKE